MLPTINKKALGRWQRLVVGLGMIGSLGLASSQAYGWNSGTHNHLADVLGSTQGSSNYQEMYGGMALDTFNYSFDPYSTYLAGLLHTDAALKLWNVAQVAGPKALPVAFGFMTHNDVWGADSTAHHDGRTYGQGTGYVIAKANFLHTLYPLPPEYGVPLEVELLMNHLVVETAVDVLLKQQLLEQQNKRLGQEIIQAAQERPLEFPDLLVAAYAEDLVKYSAGNGNPLSKAKADAFIYDSEGDFQTTMELYGQALDADQPVPLLAGQLAKLAKIYLGSLPLSEAQLTTLLSEYIYGAMAICGDKDSPGFYAEEIAETKLFVEKQLQLHGITYDVSAVPLPPTVLLFGFGLAGMALIKLRSHPWQ